MCIATAAAPPALAPAPLVVDGAPPVAPAATAAAAPAEPATCGRTSPSRRLCGLPRATSRVLHQLPTLALLRTASGSPCNAVPIWLSFAGACRSPVGLCCLRCERIPPLPPNVKDPLASSLAGRGSPLDLTEIRRLQDSFTRTTYNLYTKTHKDKEVQTKTSNNNYTSDRYILL